MYPDNENNHLIPMENFYFENCNDGDLNIQHNQNLCNYQISQHHQNIQDASLDCEKFRPGVSDSFTNLPVPHISKKNNIATPEILNANLSVANCQNLQGFNSTPQYCNQIQTPQHAVTLSEFLILKPRQNNDVMRKRHRAHISLVSTPTGIKTIVKRKRKRTIFTTEQIETLEEIFKSRPYINRDDRQVLVQKLQVSDKSVKVWFQNRRLKGKRNEQTAVTEMREEWSSPDLAMLDYVESQINEKTDEFGFVTLDDEVMSDLANVIDNFLSDSRRFNVPFNDGSDEISYAGGSPIYEPISPASVTDCTSEEENSQQWEPNEPKESLQRLFDLQYLVPL